MPKHSNHHHLPTELTELSVKLISLVKNPANQRSLILKSDEGLNLFQLQKTDDERQVVYAIVYSPNEVDTQGDFATLETIEKASYRFMKTSQTQAIDLEHNQIVQKGVFIAESWLIKTGDTTFKNAPVGSWAVGLKVEDNLLWQDLKKGAYQGISLFGKAHRKKPKTTQHKTLTQENTMDEKQVKQLIADELAKVVKSTFEQSLNQQLSADIEKAVQPFSHKLESLVLELTELKKGAREGALLNHNNEEAFC